MLIRVNATPNAREARVVRVSNDYYELRVDEGAVGGRANKRLLEILAEHLSPKIENLHSKRNKIKKEDGPSDS